MNSLALCGFNRPVSNMVITNLDSRFRRRQFATGEDNKRSIVYSQNRRRTGRRLLTVRRRPATTSLIFDCDEPSHIRSTASEVAFELGVREIYVEHAQDRGVALVSFSPIARRCISSISWRRSATCSKSRSPTTGTRDRSRPHSGGCHLMAARSSFAGTAPKRWKDRSSTSALTSRERSTESAANWTHTRRFSTGASPPFRSC